MKQCVMASSNVGKIREFNALLEPRGFEVIPQNSLGIESVPETGLTFVENALIKARHAAHMSGKPALADDSGLVVPALNGAPGLYSARYAASSEGYPGESTDERNLNKLLATLQDLTGTQRAAFYVCILVWLEHPEDPTPLICEGRWHGFIAREASGQQGFGYDPIFIPKQNLPAGCASPDDLTIAPPLATVAHFDKMAKNAISHRGLAMRELLERLA
ncbi:MAG: RdgB/HAM1 family non-canonical purine NTP pyrophosphatase [Hahellaceae bacterium]|nr:RdgB/HAM1 family non-canonical purine NTP pyrophosphatase [Hahellaceae bacterium]